VSLEVVDFSLVPIFLPIDFTSEIFCSVVVISYNYVHHHIRQN
jgi:hypothetical protein